MRPIRYFAARFPYLYSDARAAGRAALCFVAVGDAGRAARLARFAAGCYFRMGS